jgi:hypothetical protein
MDPDLIIRVGKRELSVAVRLVFPGRPVVGFWWGCSRRERF